MLSNEILIHILSEAERIVSDAESLLDKAQASGRADVIEAALHNLRQVIENRDRLTRILELRG